MKAAVLFPGKQNHWVIAMPPSVGRLSEQDRAKAARVWFTVNFPDDYEDFRYTGSQVGSPELIKGNFLTKDNVNLPENTVYIGIAFDYLGDEDVMPWPESNTGQLWAVLQGVPTIHLKSPIEEELETIGRTVDDIKSDTGDAIDRAKEKVDAAFSAAPYILTGLAVIAYLWGSRNQR